jgi:hypothetical protein
VATVLIGATMNVSELDEYAPMLIGNNITRIFPANERFNGTAVKVLPPWDDKRFTYCRNVGAIPFVSTKVDGWPAGLDRVREQLAGMPDWITCLYITDRHEPEGDLTPAAYQANFNAFLAMVESLPAGIRARIRCGPVLTLTWTERPAGKWDYSTYDPGTGDFFGVDAYVQSGTAAQVVSPGTLPAPVDFLKKIRGYRKNAGDTRPRILPEIGVIGMPDDADGTARADWIRGIHTETSRWGPDTTGWEFIGWIWWHATGKATGVVNRIGQRRDFPLHLRAQPGTAAPWDDASAVVLPGRPPAPVVAFNQVFAAENTPPPGPAPDPAPVESAGWDTSRIHFHQAAGWVWMQATLLRTGADAPATAGTVLFTIPDVFRPATDFDLVASWPTVALRLTVHAATGEVRFAEMGGDLVCQVPSGSWLTIHPVTYPSTIG